MRINMVGAFIRNAPFGTEIAFKKGFDRLGKHQVTIVDPSYPDQKFDEDADFTLVFKYIEQLEYRQALERVRGKKVVFQPDDMRFPQIMMMMKEMRRYCDYALSFDADCAKIAMDLGFRASKKMLVTADDELYHPMDVEKDIDFVFVGSLTGGACHMSRRKMLEVLHRAGFKVGYFHDIYDIPKIVELYSRAKVVLNHATDVGQPFGHGYGYQCRHFEAGFTRACLLSNEVDNSENGDPMRFFVFDSDMSLVASARMLLDAADVRKQWADLYYDELMVSHRPEHRAQAIVDFFEQDCR